MKQDKETRNKLLESARREFMEKGYMKASLRTICKNAGVTTGALYFFFQDKEDLFESIAKETINNIWQIMQGHYSMERDLAEQGTATEEIQDSQFRHQQTCFSRYKLTNQFHVFSNSKP